LAAQLSARRAVGDTALVSTQDGCIVPRFEYFMALRYLRGAEGRAEGRSFLRFITYVAIGGVALGVAALLLALAIVRGFSQEITEKIVGFGSHVQVQNTLQEEPLPQASDLKSRIARTEGVASVAPIIEGVVLLRRSAQSIDGVQLVGVDEPPAYIERHVSQGAFDLRSAPGEPQRIVVGAALAERMDVEVGETVTLFGLQNAGAEGLQLDRPRVRQFRVTGIYRTSLTSIDGQVVFTAAAPARALVGMAASSVSRFDVTVDDFGAVDDVAARLNQNVSFPATARTIRQIQPYASLFAWVNLQQGIIPLVIGVIVIVAAFNIVGILLMMILEKTREIGVLQSIGTSQTTLKRLFLAVGVLIGAVGTAAGAGLAFLLASLQKQFGIIPLPEEAYYMTTAPIALHPLDYLLVAVVTLVLCGLAAYIPARVAARIEPVQAIRFQ
jgi:lipoprotein-releasing system permease protein